MISSPFFLTALIAAIQPAAAPTASPGPLREIGHVRATVCGSVVVHANSAISSAISNDRALANTIFHLRNANFEGNPLERQQGVNALSLLAAQLGEDAAHGDSEVKRLRAMASHTTDPTRKAQLETFTDALGGALHRQQNVARDLNGFLAYLDYRDMHDQSEQQSAMNAAISPNAEVGQNGRALPLNALTLRDSKRESPNAMAQEAAVDFQGRIAEIAADETKAADHAEGAVSGC